MRSLLLFLCSAPLFAQLLPIGATVNAVGVDPNGFIYVAGQIGLTDLPVTPGVVVPGPLPKTCGSPDPCYHGFVAKITPSGESIVWATYLGGEGMDTVNALAVAPDGTIVVAGTTTSKSFQPLLGGYQRTAAGVFVLRLSPDARWLVNGTFFGGQGADSVSDLKLDASGNVYIAGAAYSSPFPTTVGAYQRDRNTESPAPMCDAGPDEFVAKFNPTLTSLLFSTLIARPGPNEANALALGPDGAVYVASTTGRRSGTCPTPAPDITRLAPDGGSAVYSTVTSVIGGGYAIAVDSQGVAYVGADTRYAAGYAPNGTLLKVSPQGEVIVSSSIAGAIGRIAVKDDHLVVEGGAAPNRLPETPGAPGVCVEVGMFTTVPYVAHFDEKTLTASYLGYLNGNRGWLLDSDRVLVTLPYTTAKPFAVLPAGQPPAGTPTCITSSARLSTAAIAPGELVSIYGIEIGPSTPFELQLDNAGNVTSSLGGYSVRVGGLPAPMLYAGLNQINFVTPFGIAAGDKTHVEILRNGSIVAEFDKRLTGTAVGLFRANATGAGALAVINQDGTVNSESNPAAAGSVVALYATGFGLMSPIPVDGTRPAAPVSKPDTEVVAFFGAMPATIEYIGNAPTLVQGVVQINVRLPLGVATAANIIITATASSSSGSTDSGGIYVR